MSRCWLDLHYLCKDNEYIFLEKALFCGITGNGRSFVKEISLVYPCTTESRGGGVVGGISTKNGHIESKRRIDEFLRALHQFDVIVVRAKEDIIFVESFLPPPPPTGTNKRVVVTLLENDRCDEHD